MSFPIPAYWLPWPGKTKAVLCATFGANDTARMSAAALFLAVALRQIRVQPPAADALWRVTYEYSQPVTRIELDRNGTYRRKDWRVETAGYIFEDHMITLRDGTTPRKSVTVAFPVDLTVPVKDY